MTDRFTKKDAIRAFKRLAETMGKNYTNCYVKTRNGYKATVGCWYLDYNPDYGGYVVNEIVSEDGRATCPLGVMRRSSREFCAMVDAIIRARKMAEESVSGRIIGV